MNNKVKAVFMLGMLCAPVVVAAAWDGVIDWAQRTALSTATSGVVEKVLVRAGDRVKKGETLLKLEQGALRAGFDQARAELHHQKLLREEAKRELERTQELYARTLLADHDLQLAKIDYANAEAAYQRSRAGYHQAHEALQNSELHAPFDAVVLERRVQPAETVVTELRAEPMLVVAAADKMLVRFPLTGGDAVSLKPGREVSVEVNGKRYNATVEAVVQQEGKTVAEAVFKTAETLAPGSAARISLP